MTAATLAGDLIVIDSAPNVTSYFPIGNHAFYYKGQEVVGGQDCVVVGNPLGYANPSPIPVSLLSGLIEGVDIGETNSTATPYYSSASRIILSVAEDAYQGNAQFTVSVDDTLLPGVFTATDANSVQGPNGGTTQSQTVQAFVLPANLSTGPHTVSVDFNNDLYAGTAQTDRNLYIDQINYYRVNETEDAALLRNGTQSFTVGGQGSAITLDMSEDAYNGDARFTVAVDGQKLSNVFTVSTLHTASAGAGGPTNGTPYQAITIPGLYSAGQHTITVDFLNDLYNGTSKTDRNLYLTGISSCYVTTAENGVFDSGGSQSFAFTITPNLGGTSSSPATVIPPATLSSPARSTSTSSETYQLAAGAGAVILAADRYGAVDFTGPVSDQDLWFVHSGNNLVADVLGTKDQLTLANYFAPGDASAKVDQFAAGSLKLDTQLATLIQAMSTYSAGHGAFNPQTATAMPSDTTLQHAITAAWHG